MSCNHEHVCKPVAMPPPRGWRPCCPRNNVMVLCQLTVKIATMNHEANPVESDQMGVAYMIASHHMHQHMKDLDKLSDAVDKNPVVAIMLAALMKSMHDKPGAPQTPSKN